MALTFSGLVSEVRDLLNRGGDTALITETRAKLWINEAQREIAREFPSLRDLRTISKNKLYAVQDAYEMSLAGFTPAIGRLLGVWYVEKARKIYRRLDPPVGGKNNWDREIFERQQSTDRGSPSYFYQRGYALEVDQCAGTNEAYLSVTGATATDANPSVITKNGAFSGYTLIGKDVYVFGTNVTTGWYEIDDADANTITLDSNCCTGGAGSDVVAHVGGVYWLEYSKEPTTLSGNDDTPDLTNFDLPLIHWAQAIALQSPILKQKQEGAVHAAFARGLIQERMQQERPWELADRNPYQGP